jgi:hypothetical protein
MSREVLRFAVGNPHGERSTIWRAWRSGDDVYVATRSLGGVLKASLHQAGDCFVGFTSEYAARARARGILAPGQSRQKLSWVGRPMNEDVTLLMRVIVPGSALAAIGDPKLGAKQTIWIPAPPGGHVIEIAFFLSRPGIVLSTWPGAPRMNTKLVGRFILPSGAFFYAVWRATDETTAWAEEQIREARRIALEDSASWLSPALASDPATLRMILLAYDNTYRTGVLLEAGIGDLTDLAA